MKTLLVRLMVCCAILIPCGPNAFAVHARANVNSESHLPASLSAVNNNNRHKLLRDDTQVTKEQLVVDYDSVPEAVDLGLSVMWAPYNLGAANPNQIGSYYTVDNKNIEKLWGPGWRLPTREELEELVSKCTIKPAGYVRIGSTSTGTSIMLIDIVGPSGDSIRVISTYYIEPESLDKDPMTYTRAIIPSSTKGPGIFRSEQNIYALRIEKNYDGGCDTKIDTYNTVYHSGELKRLFALRPVKVADSYSSGRLRPYPKPTPKPDASQPKPELTTDPDVPKPKPDLTPIYVPNPDRNTWMKIAQLFLDRKTSYNELRRGVHFTNEPEKDRRAKYRYTGLNLSMAEYNEWAKHGILFKTVEPEEVFKSNTMLERTKKVDEAAKGSSYPQKGTYCGKIVFIDDKYRQDMYTGKGSLGCDAYFFAMEHYKVKNILEIEEGQTNGVDLTFVIMEVEEQPTPYKKAYNQVIYEANKSLGGQTKAPVVQNKTMNIIFGFSFNKTRKVWELRLGAIINPQTGQPEEWPIQ